MNIERTIHICGKDVLMCYCTATETGYESISGKSSVIFIPKITKDEHGNIQSVTPQSNVADCITLAVAGIIASYTRRHQDAPISSEDIMYEASPEEVQDLIRNILEMRNEWYKVPILVKSQEGEQEPESSDADAEKN